MWGKSLLFGVKILIYHQSFTSCVYSVSKKRIDAVWFNFLWFNLVRIKVKTWFLYSFSPEEGTGKGHHANHLVQAIGWGYDQDTQDLYFIIKNSWGEDWGDFGYAKIKSGTCGILQVRGFLDKKKTQFDILQWPNRWPGQEFFIHFKCNLFRFRVPLTLITPYLRNFYGPKQS